MLIQNIKTYKTDFDAEFNTVYYMLHRNKYDHIIPGISDIDNKE